jgi:hypothetical protein
MTRDEIINEYFDWLYDIACHNKLSNRHAYKRLFAHIHDTEFTPLLDGDFDRADDGLSLRYRFACERDCIGDAEIYLDPGTYGPCSVLEMMIALALRCEETIMDDPEIGDRTGQWFWEMMVNLGIGSMIDSRYDRATVDSILSCFNNREYSRDGKGGLFRIRNCSSDLRSVDIWHQLCWYLNSITD